MAPKSEEDRYFSPIFFSFRVFSSPENNFDTFFCLVVGSLFFSQRKKRKHMGEILGWEEILNVWTDDFGATSSSSKIPAVRKINESARQKKDTVQ